MLSRVLSSNATRFTATKLATPLASSTTLSNSRFFSSESSGEEIEGSITVPKTFVRFIIGPKGSNAARLTEASGGARIKFSRDEPGNTATEEVARIHGTPAQVEEMQRLIREDIAKLEKDPPTGNSNNFNAPAPGSITEELSVEARQVGFLIGKGGVILKEMENMSGARIRYSEMDPSQPDRTCQLSGTREQIDACKKLITDRLFQRQEEDRQFPDRQFGGGGASRGGDRRGSGGFGGNMRNNTPSRGGGGGDSQVVEVPADIVGSLIGKGGLALHRLQDDTGARFDFGKEEVRPGVKAVTISGDKDQVRNGCDALTSRVQEINSRNQSRN